MNSGFSDYQDLINTTESGDAINDIQDDIKSLEDDVKENSDDIVDNSAAISSNVTAIANNGVLINNNTAGIGLNTGNISQNTTDIAINRNNMTSNTTNIGINTSNILQNNASIINITASISSNQQSINTNTASIATNTTSIASNTTNISTNQQSINTNTASISSNQQAISNINADVSGKVSKSGDTMTGILDMGNNAINNCNAINGIQPSQISTNQINIGTKLSKSGDTVTGDLRLDGGSLLLENYTDRIRFRNNNAVIAEIGVGAVQPSQALDIIGAPVSGTNTVKIWNNLDVEGNVGFNGSINGIPDTTLQYIAGLTSDAQTQFNVNASSISTNTAAISNNISDIVTNVTAINTKLSLSGGTMTGDLLINRYSNLEFGDGVSKLNGFGLINYDIVTATRHRLDIIGALSSTTQAVPETRLTGTLEITSNTRTNGGLTVKGTYGDMNRGSSHGGVRQLRLYNTINDDASWAIGNQYNAPSTSDNDLYFEVTYTNGNAHQAGFVQDDRTNVQMNFTGQHRCMPMGFAFTADKAGLIVETTGRYMDLLRRGDDCSQISCISINDSIPMVRLCNESKSRKIFGVISAREDDDRRTFGGNFVSNYSKELGDERIFINSIGEGGIWVCDLGGNLSNGDYICASGINGYGMHQDDDLLHNYTVAKITMDCDFNPQLETVKVYAGYDEKTQSIIWDIKLDIEGNVVYKPQYKLIEIDGMKIAFVGCTYHCG